jgi:hypothetical protein
MLPKSAPQPPSGGVWLHEIKRDGFRVIGRDSTSMEEDRPTLFKHRKDLRYR